MARCPETTTYRIHRTQYQPWNEVVVHNAHLTLIGTKLRLQIALCSAKGRTEGSWRAFSEKSVGKIGRKKNELSLVPAAGAPLAHLGCSWGPRPGPGAAMVPARHEPWLDHCDGGDDDPTAWESTSDSFDELLASFKREDQEASAAAKRRQAEEEAAARAEEARRVERARAKRRAVAEKRAKEGRAKAEERAAAEAAAAQQQRAELASVAARQRKVERSLAARERELEERERMLRLETTAAAGGGGGGGGSGGAHAPAGGWAQTLFTLGVPEGRWGARRAYKKRAQAIMLAAFLLAGLWLATLETNQKQTGKVGGAKGSWEHTTTPPEDIPYLPSYIKKRDGARPRFGTLGWDVPYAMSVLVSQLRSAMETGQGRTARPSTPPPLCRSTASAEPWTLRWQTRPLRCAAYPTPQQLAHGTYAGPHAHAL
jgi:hypothetical protein